MVVAVVSQANFQAHSNYTQRMYFKFRLRMLVQRLNFLLRGSMQGVSIGFLSKSGSSILTDFSDLVDIFPKLQLHDFELARSIYRDVVQKQSRAIYPENYDSGENLNAFLYSYIKAYKPQTIVETGVANGITTNIILMALAKTSSVLHSFDIDERTRNVHPQDQNWKHHLLKKSFHKDLESTTKELGTVDLWLHDSNHGGLWQSFEYTLALGRLHSNGILVSDDVDASTAWATVIGRREAESFVIHDHRKIIGISKK